MAEENTPEDKSPPQSQRVPQNLTDQQVVRLVSKIKGLELQVGEHVVAALQHPNTVAVLTTVVAGPSGEQHIVSAAISPERMAIINELLSQAEMERQDDQICFGFHCLVKPKP